MSSYGKCPRCGNNSMEHLKTHSFCWDCNYTPDDPSAIHLLNAVDPDDEDDESNDNESNEEDDDELQEAA